MPALHLLKWAALSCLSQDLMRCGHNDSTQNLTHPPQICTSRGGLRWSPQDTYYGAVLLETYTREVTVSAPPGGFFVPKSLNINLNFW